MHTLRLITAGLAVAATAAALVATPTYADKPGNGLSTGTGQIFMVNPVQSSGDQDLTDAKDANTTRAGAEYTTAELRNLDGSGTLSGEWVNVRTTTGTPAYSPTNTFVYTRDQDQFEQVMGYFWVNQAQEYLQSLGFAPAVSPAILARPYDLRIDQYGVDNSYMTDKGDYIRLGKGGVDDAEDAEVIMHEYGHAIHARPGRRLTAPAIDAGAIGESFGDYFACLRRPRRRRAVRLAGQRRGGLPDGLGRHVLHRSAALHPSLRPQPDAGGPPQPGALRRPDLEPGALGDPPGLRRERPHHRGLGHTLIESQFAYAADTSFQDAAKATYDSRQGA